MKIEKCCRCDNKLTQDEIKIYFEEATYCCDGRMCGCHGMPVDPPICDKCIKELEVKE